ncbi:DNA adenine methylase [Lysinibacillus sphaericus]|uniref:DNA adenine methylase n=1 Tax=Lysinibacillus sphaericus TaxID=1421 RepID=UPI002B4BF742|nr:DNA adenine methylase [Lysinibacillus sphaericus]
MTLIERYNRQDCLIYADPPYLLETRTKRHYAHEMKDSEHEELLLTLNKHKGFVLLSGYDNDLYNDLLQGWSRLTKMSTTDAATSKQEVLWLNPVVTERNKQLSFLILYRAEMEEYKLGGSFPKLSYKNLKTLKHALQEYLKREGISENDKKANKPYY